MTNKQLLQGALETIQQLVQSMALAKEMVIREKGLGDPLCNILSFDVESICEEIEKATK